MKVLFFIGTLLFFNLSFGQTDIEKPQTKRFNQLKAGQIAMEGYNADNSSISWTFSISEFLKTDSLEYVSYPALASENVIMGKVLSYKFTLVDSNGAQEISVIGNNLTAVKNLIKNAKPGGFVMFRDIKVSLSDQVIYIYNYSSTAVE
jgi:hypothetical protein